MMLDEYRVVSSTPEFTGRLIKVRTDEVQMSDGIIARREIVEHPGAVGVLALDDEERVVLVHQYRHPVRAYLHELPAGLLDVAGEPPEAAAKRELAEEAALEAADWNVLVDLYTSPGVTDEAVRVYLARGLTDARYRFQAADEELTMTVSRVPLDETVRWALAGELTNAIACAGVLAAAAARAAGWAGLRPADAIWPARLGAPRGDRPA
jgi:8-oxo-dGDP phosphatase